LLLGQTDRTKEALAAYERALELREALVKDFPRSKKDSDYLARTRANLARVLVTCPDPGARDPSRACRLAEQAVNQGPHEERYWGILGLARYRAGDWKSAAAALEKARELRQGADGADGFFLAMAYWRLGEKERAREVYDRVRLWAEKNKPNDVDAHRFRAEAAALLGMADEPGPAEQPEPAKK
jgi:eukaryotic-like serine/threonine-protein kinase